MTPTPHQLELLMSHALHQAELASTAGEVPIGAIIARGEEIISSAHNLIETNHDASAHAEILVIREASAKLSKWRLEDCALIVTLEPCPMCASAIRLSRIPLVVFGAHDPRMGAMGSLFDLSQDSRLGALPRVISGIQAEKSSQILKEFFKRCRAEE